MNSTTNGLTHDEIWDDSALVESWNSALEEYKKYHSIQAKGGSLTDAPGPNNDAKPETLLNDETARDGSLPVAAADKKISPLQQQQVEAPVDLDAGSTAVPIVQQGEGGAPAMAPPIALLGTVRDEALKKLLMSWYYAGYYTGLYEGQQQAQQQSQPQ